jgi:hypothetical protein
MLRLRGGLATWRPSGDLPASTDQRPLRALRCGCCCGQAYANVVYLAGQRRDGYSTITRSAKPRPSSRHSGGRLSISVVDPAL